MQIPCIYFSASLDRAVKKELKNDGYPEADEYCFEGYRLVWDSFDVSRYHLGMNFHLLGFE